MKTGSSEASLSVSVLSKREKVGWPREVVKKSKKKRCCLEGRMAKGEEQRTILQDSGRETRRTNWREEIMVMSMKDRGGSWLSLDGGTDLKTTTPSLWKNSRQ